MVAAFEDYGVTTAIPHLFATTVFLLLFAGPIWLALLTLQSEVSDFTLFEALFD